MGWGFHQHLQNFFLFVVFLLLHQHVTCILQALLDYYRVNEHVGAEAAPSSGMQRRHFYSFSCVLPASVICHRHTLLQTHNHAFTVTAIRPLPDLPGDLQWSV